jgi:predicted ArsR family transcriptional regulator
MEKVLIPRTGRIGRFAKIIEIELGEKILLKVMQDSEKYSSLRKYEQAAWWKSATDKLEREVGKEKAERIMNLCGQKCCGKGIRKTAKRLMDESKSIEEFLERASTDDVKEGEVEYKLQDNNTIIGTFNRCFCGQVAQTKTLFNNRTYCQCSVEFHKQYFEAALGNPVKVELIQSIINGAKACKFHIHIPKSFNTLH